MNAFEQFFNALRTLHPFNEDEKEFLVNNLKPGDYKRGKFFVKEGDYATKLAFIIAGHMRKFSMNQKGDEVTSEFAGPNNFIGAYYSFYRQSPSFENIHAMDDCTVLILTYDDLQRLYSDSFNMNIVGRKILENACVQRDIWLNRMVSLSSAERYEWFVENFPEIVRIGQLQHIASFLGIKRETLSRIRRKKL